MVLFGMVVAIFMTIFWNLYRVRETMRPITIKKIVLPPLFMSTGAFMYFVPAFRLTKIDIIEAILLGAICSIFLVRTSKFEVKENQVYLQRSKAFLIVILGLFIVRTGIKSVLSAEINYGELSGMFFLVAFVMIVIWRINMYLKYMKIVKDIPKIATSKGEH